MSGLADLSAHEGRNEMFASTIGSEHGKGAIRVVPERDELVAVCLEGEFDLTNATVLGDEIDRILESGNGVIVDLSETTFIDSSVIHVLMRAAKTATGRERTIVLQLGTAAVVERALEISGIERLLPRAHDREEAVRVIRSTGTHH
jgi:anti-sigma B factor antagonist